VGTLVWAAANGVVPLSRYPYSARTGRTCGPAFGRQKVKAVGGALPVALNMPEPLYKALQQAPVTITIWAEGVEELYHYGGGEGGAPRTAQAERH